MKNNTIRLNPHWHRLEASRRDVCLNCVVYLTPFVKIQSLKRVCKRVASVRSRVPLKQSLFFRTHRHASFGNIGPSCRSQCVGVFNSVFFTYRRQQEVEASASSTTGGTGSAPPLVSELRALRQRKDELEGHLSSLQESRKHLMQQLEGLMRMLKVLPPC